MGINISFWLVFVKEKSVIVFYLGLIVGVGS